MRGSVDGWDFASYVLGMLFYRFISENLIVYLNEDERTAGNPDFEYATLTETLARRHRLRTAGVTDSSTTPATRRPAVVVAGDAYLANITQLAVVVPVTSSARGWPNHVRLQGSEVGLDGDSFAMTEQLKTIDRRRIQKVAGRIDETTQRAIDGWLRDFLDLRG